MSRLQRFPTGEALYDALAEEIASRLTLGVEARGSASFVASGGTTPGPVFERLSAMALAWDRVQVTASDERWVGPEDSASNQALVRRTLLQGPGAAARYIPLKNDAPTPEAGQAAAHWAIAALPRPFDVTLLGMGTDGHTASLFPGAEGLQAALDLSDPTLARAVRPLAAAGSTERVSLTLRALLDSRWIAILIRGQDKLDAYQRAMADLEDVAKAPVRAILGQDTVPVGIWWAT